MSISITQGQAITANIAYSGATANDDAYLIIYQNSIPQFSFLSKENEAEKKLTISAGVGYSFTMSGNKTRFLKDVSTYKLYRNNELIASGTITITVTEGVPDTNRITQANYFICDELPEISLFADGTIVSVDGVLYVKKDGAWEKQGNSVDEEVSIVINKDNYTDTHSLEFSTPVLLAEVELILYHMDEDARNALSTLTSSEQQSGRYKKHVINKPSFGTGMSLTDTVLASLDVPAVGMLESLIPYTDLKLDDIGEARVDIDWSAFHNVFSFSEGANCSIKVIARLKVLA